MLILLLPLRLTLLTVEDFVVVVHLGQVMPHIKEREVVEQELLTLPQLMEAVVVMVLTMGARGTIKEQELEVDTQLLVQMVEEHGLLELVVQLLEQPL
jgi:hypothetical protein